VNFREFLEEKVVIGHGVENAGRGEQDAVGGAEGGNQDRERNDLAAHGPRTWPTAVAANRVAGGHARGAEGEEVRDDGQKIQTTRISEPARKARGKFFCGSMTSPAL